MAKYNILALMHEIDTPKRYNYQVNFGFLDELGRQDEVDLHKYDMETLASGGGKLLQKIIDKHDINLVTGPLHIRWKNTESLPSLIKKTGLPMVIFDNDSFQFDFKDEFYSYFDWIFYRDHDRNNDTPSRGSFLPWSIDTDLYAPEYGGTGIVLCATIKDHYPNRVKIREEMHPHLVNCTQYTGDQYIKHLQRSLIAINTGSTRFNFTAAKLIEIASCGTAIITENTHRLNVYFQNELLYIFHDMNELRHHIHHANSNIDEVLFRQKMLRKTVENHHSNTIRAREILEVLENKVF